jgi:peptidoglycan/LPS O-acetylase OafA/YrhL
VSRLSQFRVSQTSEPRPRREAKIIPPTAAGKAWPDLSRFGGTYLADMLAPDRNSFAIIRMAMALAVLVSHSYWFAIGTIGSQPLVSWTGHSLGEHAVQVFFLLSGILVAQSLSRSGSIVDYVCARALRIFPALAVCVFLTAFVLGPIVTNLGLAEYLKDNRVAAYIVKTLTLSTGSAPLPGVFTDLPLANLVNVSLWTLKFEVLCYFALAGLGIAGLMSERYRTVSVVGLAVFVSLVFLRQPVADAKYTAVDNIRYLMLFFFTGVLAFQCRQWLYVHGLIVVPLAAIFAASIGTRFVELSSAVFLGYTMLWLSTFSFGPLRDFTNKNDYSYGTYIYAGPIQQMIVHFLPGFAPWVVTAFAVGIAVPLAVYSWELIERPALALRQPIRDWLFGFSHRIDAMLAALRPGRAAPSIAEPLAEPMAMRQAEPAVADTVAPAFANAFAAAATAALVPAATGTESAVASVLNVNGALTTRRQRRPTIVSQDTASHDISSPAYPPAKVLVRRLRPAIDLKMIKISPEVAAMHQSKSLAAAVARTRAGARAKASNGMATQQFATSDAQRTPYARNWLMSLAWLANPPVPSGPQTPMSDQGTPTVTQRPTRSVKITAPAPLAVRLAEPAAASAAPRMTLRTWLATLTGNRTPEPLPPEPVAEISSDRMAQVLRTRTPNRPKWTVPANDTHRSPGTPSPI